MTLQIFTIVKTSKLKLVRLNVKINLAVGNIDFGGNAIGSVCQASF